MEWHPFNSIVHGRRSRPLSFLLLAIAGIGLPLSYYALTRETNSYYLTTTIDLENRQILDKPLSLGEPENRLVAAARFARLALDAASGDAERIMTLASPSVAYVYIRPGLRREEIAGVFGGKVGWDETTQKIFVAAPTESASTSLEGRYFPGTYPAVKGTTPDFVSQMMTERFDKEVAVRYASSSRNIISLETALKIASLIEREAGSKKDMRLISGIIWNRIFAGMNLQIDATLQYAKGTEDNGWWPPVVPNDKFIDSPYNTYQNGGLTPSPISNPSLAAIQAALNPQKTKCMFYLHDKNKRIHCAANYEDHVRNIRRYL